MELSKIDGDDMFVRGESWNEHMMRNNFFDSVLFLLTGRRYSEFQKKDIERLMIAFMDHGPNTASAMSTRNSASTGNNLNTSIASGILSLGTKHGLAIGPAMRIFSSIKDPISYVNECIEQRVVIPGFGHPLYSEDPRVSMLQKELSFDSPTLKKARIIEKALYEAKGKKLCLNIDGYAAAVLLDLDFEPDEADSLFIISRTIGFASHSINQRKLGSLIRKQET